MSGVELTIALGLVSLLGVLGVHQVLSAYRRSAVSVMADLGEEWNDQVKKINPDPKDSWLHTVRSGRAKLVLDDALGKAGLLSEDERRRFRIKTRLFPIFSTAIGVILLPIIGSSRLGTTIMVPVMFWAIGYLVARGALARQANRYRRELEFYLPLVMERLVMAVQAGLDVLAAIGVIVELEKGKTVDPVTRLLGVVHKLAESGLTFEQALNQVANVVDCSALRHAFIHLAVAHEEGGELVMPLKELSDSTQLHFQESVEEEIAKLPVKATLPLLLTFAGLIICFVTSPLIQILSLMQKQMEAFH